MPKLHGPGPNQSIAVLLKNLSDPECYMTNSFLSPLPGFGSYFFSSQVTHLLSVFITLALTQEIGNISTSGDTGYHSFIVKRSRAPVATYIDVHTKWKE